MKTVVFGILSLSFVTSIAYATRPTARSLAVTQAKARVEAMRTTPQNREEARTFVGHIQNALHVAGATAYVALDATIGVAQHIADIYTGVWTGEPAENGKALIRIVNGRLGNQSRLVRAEYTQVFRQAVNTVFGTGMRSADKVAEIARSCRF